MEHPARLSKSFVERITSPGRYGDGRGGHGLSLLVKARAGGGWSKSWSQRLIIPDVGPVNIGLGPYPVVNLDEARAAALVNRRAVWQGRDPRTPRELKIPTFGAAFETFISLHAPGWKDARNEQQWRGSLRDYAMPTLSRKRVDRITTADVLAVLTPIWHEKNSTAKRVRRRIRAILDWTIAEGYRSDNPAGDTISAALPRNGAKTTHFKALAHADVAAALAAVQRLRRL